jgi:hypothetical protein
LDRHDGHAVCRWFAPQLRAYLVRTDALPGERTCAGAVAGHFREIYTDPHWQDAIIVGHSETTVDAQRKIAEVRITLLNHYVCGRRHPRVSRATQPDTGELMSST